MASSKDYLDYVLDLLRDVNNITYKSMMGEFLLYSDGILFGGIYDNRFLVKDTKSISHMDMLKEKPYDGAKEMFLVDSEDSLVVKEIVLKVVNDLNKQK